MMNTICYNAGHHPKFIYGNAIHQKEFALNQQIPEFFRNFNNLDQIRETYLQIIGLYIEAKRYAWMNTIFPIGYLLRLPANIIKFLFRSIFDISISEENIMWKVLAFIFNAVAWVSSVTPFIFWILNYI
jgi:hypothetical protein